MTLMATLDAQDMIRVRLPTGAAFVRNRIQHARVKTIFHQTAIHLRNAPAGFLFCQPPRRLQHSHVRIHTTKAVKVLRFAIGAKKSAQVTVWRNNDRCAGDFEPARARTLVPVQSAEALQQHVYRTQIRKEDVSVHIQRLLDRLCCHDDARLTRPFLAKALFQRRIKRLPIHAGISGMVRHDHPCTGKELTMGTKSARCTFECQLRLHTVVDGIPDHQYLGAGKGGSKGRTTQHFVI
jgi:hypothetical protein